MVFEAYACAELYTALQSCPVATQTLSIPFIIPLLCVTALYLSFFANSIDKTRLNNRSTIMLVNWVIYFTDYFCAAQRDTFLYSSVLNI